MSTLTPAVIVDGEPIPIRTISGLPGYIRFVDSGPSFRDVILIRSEVFREEQSLVDLAVTDEHDEMSVQAVAYVGGRAVACGRLTPAVGNSAPYIAWVATLPDYRKLGLATLVMEALLDVADRAGMREVVLSAQTPARPMYERLGFRAVSNPYVLKGIEHVSMVRRK